MTGSDLIEASATAWSPLLVAAGVVVAVAGAAKLADPVGTRRRLRALGGRPLETVAPAIGLFEVAVGAAAVVVGSPIVAGLLALGYAAFLATSLWARHADVSCGCFGEASSRPDVAHLLLVAAGLVVALGAVASGSGGAVALAGSGGAGLLSIISGLLAGTVAVVVMTVVPTVRAAGRRSPVPLFGPASGGRP